MVPPRQGAQPVQQFPSGIWQKSGGKGHRAVGPCAKRPQEGPPEFLQFGDRLSLRGPKVIADEDKLALEDWLRAKLNERNIDGQRWHVIAAAGAIVVVVLILLVLLHGLGGVIANQSERGCRVAAPVGSSLNGAGERESGLRSLTETERGRSRRPN
jgi:hypothetical protein